MKSDNHHLKIACLKRILFQDYNDDIRQEQMWEMQVLSQRNKQVVNSPAGEEAADVVGIVPGTLSNGSEERLSGEVTGAEGMESPHDDEHPAMRGLHAGEFA